jgi:hypothetical protein
MKFATAVVAALWCLVPSDAPALDELISGKSTTVRPGRLARFVSRSGQQPGGTPFVLPIQGFTSDPTVHGATLTFADVGGAGGTATFVLDASGWTRVGVPGSESYRYRGRDDTVDPDPHGACRSVQISGTVIKGACKAPSLSTPFTASETVVLRLGTGFGARRYCAEFGGVERKNDAEAMRRRDAPPPAACAGTACTGAEVGGACWFLGIGLDCNEVCAFEGLAYSEATRTFAGSDGTAAACEAVLDGVGAPAASVSDADCESVGIPGIGCALLLEFGLSVRCTTPPTVADAGHFDVARACACE